MQRKSRKEPTTNSTSNRDSTAATKQMGKRYTRYNTRKGNQTSKILWSKFRRISRTRKAVILAFWLFLRGRQKPKILKLIRRKKPFWLLARCALNRSRHIVRNASPLGLSGGGGLCMSVCMSFVHVNMNVTPTAGVANISTNKRKTSHISNSYAIENVQSLPT